MTDDCTFWGIDDGIDDPKRFFTLLPRLLPTATTLFC